MKNYIQYSIVIVGVEEVHFIFYFHPVQTRSKRTDVRDQVEMTRYNERNYTIRQTWVITGLRSQRFTSS